MMSLIDSDAPQQKLTDAVIVTAIFPLYQRTGLQWLSTTEEPHVCLKGQIHQLGVQVLVVLNLLRGKLLAMEGQIHQQGMDVYLCCVVIRSQLAAAKSCMSCSLQLTMLSLLPSLSSWVLLQIWCMHLLF